MSSKKKEFIEVLDFHGISPELAPRWKHLMKMASDWDWQVWNLNRRIKGMKMAMDRRPHSGAFFTQWLAVIEQKRLAKARKRYYWRQLRALAKKVNPKGNES